MKELLFVTMLFGTALFAEEPATVVSAAAPGYPRSVVSLEGEVAVDLEVAADGVVRKAQAQSGPPKLRSVAETAARQWRFAANGPDEVRIVFAFILQDGIGDPPAIASLFKPPNRVEIFAMKREVVVISDPPVGVIKKPKKSAKPKDQFLELEAGHAVVREP
jgi:hypothetical protein